jgi:hypothetical protein
MKILKWFLIVIAVLALLLVLFLAYMGMIFPLKTYESKMGPYTIAYESYIGPYGETGPVFTKVYESVKADGIETTKGLGIYYDDPGKVSADKLRSDCGIVIEQSDLAKFNKVRRKYNVKKLPQKDSIVIEFPIRNALSYFMGPMRAYPALTKYVEEKGYKFGMPYELYNEPEKKVYFIMEIVK